MTTQQATATLSRILGFRSDLSGYVFGPEGARQIEIHVAGSPASARITADSDVADVVMTLLDEAGIPDEA